MKLPACAHSFFNLQHGGGEGGEKNDQIGRAAVVGLFTRISAALSVILLYLICVLQERGQTWSQELRGRGGQDIKR